MTDGQSEIQQQIDADAKQDTLIDPYLTVIELQILGIFRKSGRRKLSARSMRHTMNINNRKLMGAIEQSNQLEYDAASGTVSLKGESDES